MVHSETTSGIISDVVPVGKEAKKHGLKFIVDCVSSFGGVPIDFAESSIDFAVTSSNKCVQGVPGFSIVFARKKELAASKGIARVLRYESDWWMRRSLCLQEPHSWIIVVWTFSLRKLALWKTVSSDSPRRPTQCSPSTKP